MIFVMNEMVMIFVVNKMVMMTVGKYQYSVITSDLSIQLSLVMTSDLSVQWSLMISVFSDH